MPNKMHCRLTARSGTTRGFPCSNFSRHPQVSWSSDSVFDEMDNAPRLGANPQYEDEESS
jgi:hypothetical protein